MILPRTYIAALLCRCSLLPRLFARAHDALIVLGYHRIRPDHTDFSTPFDDFVFGPTASQLLLQLQWLKANAHILSETDLAHVMRSPHLHTRPRVLLTFDDAYRDNYTLAFPILKSLNVPAIFFIPTQHITSRTLGLWDIIAYIVKRTSQECLRIDGHSLLLGKERASVIRYLQSRIKTLNSEHTTHLLQYLQEECDVPLPHPEIQDAELMTWADIAEVSRHNIALGSHTHTHRPLALLDTLSQEKELRTSKLILEQKTGVSVRSIAYPFGGYNHFTPHTQALAKHCGYEYAFSFGTGVNRWNSFSQHDIRRLAPPKDLCSLMAGMVLRHLILPARSKALN